MATLNEEFITAVYNNQIELVSMLLEKGVDPSIGNALHIATTNNYIELVKILLSDPRVDPSVYNNLNIRQSASYGHAEIVEMLLKHPVVDPSDLNNESIIVACESGSIETVKLLLKDSRVDSAALNNNALYLAGINRHTTIVDLLLHDNRIDVGPFKEVFIACNNNDSNKIIELLLEGSIDPSSYHNFLIVWASKYGHIELVKILLSDLRVDPISTKNQPIKIRSCQNS